MIWLAHNSVATIVERDGLFLMVEERDEGRVVFNQPAGHLDEHESLFDAARRETLEESAWHVELTALIGIYHYRAPNGVTYIRHCFAATPLMHEAQRPLDEGIIAAHWLSAATILDAAFAARSPIVARCLYDYLQGKRYPLDLIHHHTGQRAS
ncbi:MAG: NUDIX hydrolase [Pseudomonadales bacterium]|jgi:8-oxo-dGTP pyrophosphatase MutT (NUDIX family)|nr:NUDIX hydrolase [Pseudomonadales bacterium]